MTITLITTFVVSFLVCCMLEVAYAHKSCQAVLVGVKLHPVGNFGARFITIHGVG